jgi:hypothetical protein
LEQGLVLLEAPSWVADEVPVLVLPLEAPPEPSGRPGVDEQASNAQTRSAAIALRCVIKPAPGSDLMSPASGVDGRACTHSIRRVLSDILEFAASNYVLAQRCIAA